MFDREVPEKEGFAGVWGIVQSLVISASQLQGFRSGNDLKIQVFMVTGRRRGSLFDEEQDQSELQLAISPLAPFSLEWVFCTTCVHVQGKQAVLGCNLEFQKGTVRLREVKRCD